MNSDEICVLGEEIIKKFNKVEKISLGKNLITPRQREVWLRQAKQHLRIFNKAVRQVNLYVGSSRKLQTIISHVKRFKAILHQQFKEKIGKGFTVYRSRVKWEDVISAFKSRVRTGLNKNKTHKDDEIFLSDAYQLFKIRI